MLLPLNALFYFMAVKNVYITTDKEFELTIKKGMFISLMIEDDKMDATSKSCELVFDKPTLRSLANEILKICEVDLFAKKSNL